MRRLKALPALLVLGIAPAYSYYHYVSYPSSGPPYAPIFEKYDLTALPEQTVTFFVSTSGPTSYLPNDSFPSVISEIQDAVKVWNAVPTSALRLNFGGLQVNGTPQNSPGAEIIFDELPPGLLGYTGHAAATSPATAADGTQFIPIVESLIHLNINLTKRPGPSYSEIFFTTVVHEMGHAIGLQHTFSSATMSTAVTRATSRARPLDADDIAGASQLYPYGTFPAAFGSITGQVTMNGQGVNLASVVALLPNGSAISNLTNPDGTFEIDGVPPGTYWVYVHPVPPTANILLPLDANGNQIPASQPFVSTFYPGTTNPAQFGSVTVTPGGTVKGVDFAVKPRSSVEIYDVTSYAYIGSNYVQPAYLHSNSLSQTLVLAGTGILDSSNHSRVRSAQVLAAPPGTGLAAYPVDAFQDVNVYLLAAYLNYPSQPASGPEHLLITLPDDIYVLPQAVQMVSHPPPAVTALHQNRDGSITVAGTGMGLDSRVFFDGLSGNVTASYAAGASQATPSGTVSVMPPPGASGQTATITIYNADGQNSMFLQSQDPFTYTYPQTSAPVAAISISALPQGASAMFKVTTSDMQFLDGLTTLGLGTGDVAVRRLWVMSPTEAWANVTVSPFAMQIGSIASVVSGFQVYEQLPGFQILPADPSLPIIGLPVPNAISLQNSLYPGAIASVYGVNLMAGDQTPVLNVAGQPCQILYSSTAQINFVIPASVATGPAIFTLHNGTRAALPVVLQIDPPPPVILSAATSAGVLNATNAAAPGDTVTLQVTGMDPALVSAPSRVAVAEDGVIIPSFTIQPAPGNSGALLIQFTLAAAVTGQQLPVTVSVDGDLSMPIYINVAAPATSSHP
jgi:uncharacterized protein (TIGR03437 family)